MWVEVYGNMNDPPAVFHGLPFLHPTKLLSPFWLPCEGIVGVVHCSENCKLTSCHHADNTSSMAHPKFKCRQPSTDANQVLAVHLQSYHSCLTCLRLEPRWLIAILADSISYKPLSPPKARNIIFYGVLLSMCLTGEDID